MSQAVPRLLQDASPNLLDVTSAAPSQAAPIILQVASPEANTASCLQSPSQAQVLRACLVQEPESDLLVLISSMRCY